ncbi:hydrogenase maturation protease [Hoyosella sp. YIM 151337]|uniref:hydrogenase maturation protease n=1 Tax=Hoyosella sp. YIM 151337 TaxID=2992742 RepID=UPI002235FAEB|nr:hydrogenase maturation protease [Hoyosella sp. YIM 151337]MCW4355972.1 hydrogenase maturation protease [Hoyosella sp. YIM 151337]
MTGAPAGAVVIGVGNEFRGDDGLGPAVIARLRKLALPGVRLAVSHGEPTELLDLWSGTDLTIVIDAVCCEHTTPGRIWTTTAEAMASFTTATSSHALGIADAVKLGRVLDRVPDELVVIAVEAECFEAGTQLSVPVADALPHVVTTVLAELARHGLSTPPAAL